VRKKSSNKKLKSLKEYVYITRSPLYGYLLVFPLFIVYELLTLKHRQTQMMDIRNGADVLLKNLLEYVGVQGILTCSAILIGLIFIYILYNFFRSRTNLQFRYFGFMIIESAILALIFGLIMGQMASLFTLRPDLEPIFSSRILLSIGAGIYEELLFRVLLLSGILFFLTRILRIDIAPASLIATIISALAFASFHYLGPGKEDIDFYSFMFRLLAGLVFGVLYVFRGFGIAAYTHTFYDLYLDLYLASN